MAFGKQKHSKQDNEADGTDAVVPVDGGDVEGDEPAAGGELEGPFDLEDFDDPETAAVGRLDLGSVLIPMPDAGQVQVELNETGAPSAVWVITPTELRGPALAALRDGARTVALHLLRSRASADLERQVESEAVLRLLDGAADAVTVASRLGLAGGPLRVIALRARLQSEPHTALLVVFERATSGFGWSRPGRTALAGNTGRIKTVLTDQKVIAGIGNAYSDEILHVAKLSPFATAGKLTESQLAALHDAMVSVLTDAVQRSVGQQAATLKGEKRSGLRVHARTGPRVGSGGVGADTQARQERLAGGHTDALFGQQSQRLCLLLLAP
mgnify:CR=1 FL=1